MVLDFLTLILLSITPVSELRGAIPYGLIIRNLNPPLVFAFSTLANMLAIPLAFLFLDFLHHRLVRIKPYSLIFNRFVGKTRRRAHKYVEKYGWMGLAVFVAIPLPVTGAYSGTLAAWLLNVERKRAILALSVGVLIAGIIVTSLVLTGQEASLFIGRALID